MLSAAGYFQWDKAVSRLDGDAGLERLNQELETEIKNWFASNGEQEFQSLKVGSKRYPSRCNILYLHSSSIHRFAPS
jgi:hypothetical protein